MTLNQRFLTCILAGVFGTLALLVTVLGFDAQIHGTASLLGMAAFPIAVGCGYLFARAIETYIGEYC